MKRQFFLFSVFCLIQSVSVFAQWDNVEVGEDTIVHRPQSDVFFHINIIPKELDVDLSGDMPIAGWREMAEWYRDQRDFDMAEQTYSNFINTPMVDQQDLYNYVLVLKALGRHQDVLPYMKRMREKKPNDLRVKSYFSTLSEMKIWKAPSEVYRASNLDINDKNNYLCAMYYKKDQVVLISSKSNAKKYSIPSLCTATALPDVELEKVKSWRESNWGKWNEGTASFAKNGKMLAFTHNDYSVTGARGLVRPQIFISQYKKQEWQEAEPLPVNDTLFNYGVAHPAFNRRGNVLYFVSDMPGGFGGTDIYEIHRVGKGWSKPHNLGDKINTEGDEMFPFYDETTGFLYFSSNGHNGLGGLDIFEAEKLDSCDCSYDVRNLGSPVNSISDDYGFVFNKAHTHGYFTSDRAEGKGGHDIYKFIYVYTKRPTEKPLPSSKDRNKRPNSSSVDEKIKEAENKVAYNLMVKNTETNAPIAGAEVKINDTILFTDDDGEIVYDINKGEHTKMKVEALGYLPITKDLIVGQVDMTDSIKMKVALGHSIVLKNIYYDFDKSEILEESAVELDKLVNFLKDNPSLTVELSSHTDSRGSDDYNLKLSQARAKSAVDYVISKGIDSSRIKGIGYGETKLLNRCFNGEECSEEQHRENRRTEIFIPNAGHGIHVKQTKGKE
jgi:outer membrane protein OmpA-like peptidoglycan-associated protein